MEKTKNEKKGKALSAASGVSGGLGLLGGWQICHNLCLGIIALLSAIGITVAGMPLLFLTQYAVYFWSAAVLLLVPTVFMYLKNRKCMPMKLILFNIGIVTASVPFWQQHQIIFWAAGGILIFYSVYLFARHRIGKVT
ncbi:MAG: hypothetical protein HY517_03635 [Candidatus Aenigmarchaeota archaeon]|nr:hypothetical protein [Candidatus Aenigmarchaeota archaeon]